MAVTQQPAADNLSVDCRWRHFCENRRGFFGVFRPVHLSSVLDLVPLLLPSVLMRLSICATCCLTRSSSPFLARWRVAPHYFPSKIVSFCPTGSCQAGFDGWNAFRLCSCSFFVRYGDIVARGFLPPMSDGRISLLLLLFLPLAGCSLVYLSTCPVSPMILWYYFVDSGLFPYWST